MTISRYSIQAIAAAVRKTRGTVQNWFVHDGVPEEGVTKEAWGPRGLIHYEVNESAIRRKFKSQNRPDTEIEEILDNLRKREEKRGAARRNGSTPPEPPKTKRKRGRPRRAAV